MAPSALTVPFSVPRREARSSPRQRPAVAAWVGTGQEYVAVTPDDVTNTVSNTVSVIRTATKTVVKTIPVGTNPAGVAVTPDGTKVYVVNFTSNNVSVIHRPGTRW